jgi:predicted DNA-binding antitoxin AbrB/MazE fold protein
VYTYDFVGNMVEIVQAVYKDGTFTPLAETHIPDGMTVRLLIESDEDVPSQNSLCLAMDVYDGLSDEDIREVEKCALESLIADQAAHNNSD